MEITAVYFINVDADELERKRQISRAFQCDHGYNQDNITDEGAYKTTLKCDVSISVYVSDFVIN